MILTISELTKKQQSTEGTAIFVYNHSLHQVDFYVQEKQLMIFTEGSTLENKEAVHFSDDIVHDLYRELMEVL